MPLVVDHLDQSQIVVVRVHGDYMRDVSVIWETPDGTGRGPAFSTDYTSPVINDFELELYETVYSSFIFFTPIYLFHIIMIS